MTRSQLALDNHDLESQFAAYAVSNAATGENALNYDAFDLHVNESIEHSRYISLCPNLNEVTFIQSAMDTGKTTIVKELVSRISAIADSEYRKPKILVVTHRKALNRQLAKELNIQYYEDVKRSKDNDLAICDDLATSPESLARIPATNKYDLVFIDEASQVLDHTLLSRTMRGANRGAYNKLRAIVGNASTVVLADAYDSKQLQHFLLSIAKFHPEKVFNKITNTFRPHAAAGDKVYIHRSRNGLIGAAREHRASNPAKKIAGISNEVEKCSVLVEALESKNAETFVVTGSQNNDLGTDELISNILNSDTFITSPALTSGFSVGAGHGFEVAFCDFGARSITAEESIQMMHRLRQISRFDVFIGSASVNRYLPITTTGVINRLIREQEAFEFRTVNANADYDQDGELIIDDFSIACAAAIAERNRSLNNFKGHMINLLSDQGFTIVYVDECENEQKNIGKEIVSTVKTRLNEEHQAELEEVARVFASTLHIDAAESMKLAIRNDKFDLMRQGIKNAQIAHMSKAEARAADVNDKKHSSAIDLTRFAASKRLLDKIYGFAGIDVETFKLNENFSWSKNDESQIKKLMHKNHWTRFDQLGIPINSKSKPIAWFNRAIKHLGLDIITIRNRQYDSYRLDPRSIEILQKLLAAQ